MRKQLERAGLDPAQVEAQLAATPGVGGSSQSISTRVSASASIRDRSGHTIGLHGGLEMQHGHPVMDDELRAELERHGVDPAMVEAQLDGAAPGQSQWQASYSTSGELRSCSFSENGATGSFEIRAGRPVLTADSRAGLEKSGVDAAAFEAAFQERVEVNELGVPPSRPSLSTASRARKTCSVGAQTPSLVLAVSYVRLATTRL
jgi:hypothetical protein